MDNGRPRCAQPYWVMANPFRCTCKKGAYLDDCPGLVYHFIPLAQNTARKWFKICRGESRGLDLEDVMAEAVAMLPSIARTYRQEKGSVVAVVKPAVWRQLERKFGAAMNGDPERLYAEVPEVAEEATQERSALVSRVREWANTKARREFIEALDSGESLSAPQEAMLKELRAHMDAPVKTAGLWTIGRTAKYLRIPERKLRKLCARGEIPAVRDKGWYISRRDADKYRRRLIIAALESGSTIQAAAVEAQAARITAQRVHRANFEKVPPGRRVDYLAKAEMMAVLTDESRAPHTWHRGKPCISAVARFLGCARMTVQRQVQQMAHT